MCSKEETVARLSYLHWGIWLHWIFHANGNTAVLEGLLLLFVSLDSSSAWFSKYKVCIYYLFKASVVQGSLIILGHWLFFPKNSWALLECLSWKASPRSKASVLMLLRSDQWFASGDVVIVRPQREQTADGRTAIRPF